jgi:hypothetical protein
MAEYNRKKGIGPQAMVAGAAVVAIGLLLYRKSATSCDKFHDIYKSPGPIYLTQEAQNEAFSFAKLRLRSIQAADQLITKQRLQRDIAEELSPACDWGDVPKGTEIKRRVWDSFGIIASNVYEEHQSEGGA